MAIKKRVTIKDVGAEAGVSWTTVSRVLTGGSFSERISPETKSRIFAASRKLGYRPHASGVALKRGYTNTVALLIVDWEVATAHSRAIVRLTPIAEEHGLGATIHMAADDREARSLVELIRSSCPYGLLLIWDSVNIPIQELADLRSEGLPVLDLMPHVPGGPTSITWDRQQGFQIGVEHLVELGHKKIAIMVPKGAGTRTTVVKREGYELGLREAGMEIDESLIVEVEGDEFLQGLDGFKELYSRRSDVTAVMCMADPTAVGVLTAARELGLEVPRDISITGYGARAGWHLVPPKVTTIAARVTQIVKKAMEAVESVREDPSFEPEGICEPMVLVLGGSTGPVR